MSPALREGVKPSELSVEQPTKFELVVNVRTVSSLGLSVKPALLVSADDRIDGRFRLWHFCDRATDANEERC
jgi:hypothetical protein